MGAIGDGSTEDADGDREEDIMAMVILMWEVSLGLGMMVQQYDERKMCAIDHYCGLEYSCEMWKCFDCGTGSEKYRCVEVDV